MRGSELLLILELLILDERVERVCGFDTVGYLLHELSEFRVDGGSLLFDDFIQPFELLVVGLCP